MRLVSGKIWTRFAGMSRNMRQAVLLLALIVLNVSCLPGTQSSCCEESQPDGGSADSQGPPHDIPPPWGELEDRCPPEEREPTPFTDYREPGSSVGQTGVLWTVDPSCDEGPDRQTGGLHYGVIEWEGEQREVLLNVNNTPHSQMLDNPVTSIMVLDATTGERMACVEMPDDGFFIGGATLLLEEPPVFYMMHFGPFSPASQDASQHIGVLGLEIAPQESREPLFNESWGVGVEREEAPDGLMTLSRGGLLGITVSRVGGAGTHIGVMDAKDGTLYWDVPLSAEGKMQQAWPSSGFRSKEGDARTFEWTFKHYDDCGGSMRSLSYESVPLGGYRVGYEYSGTAEARRVSVRDDSGELLASTDCGPPSATGEETLSCVHSGSLKVFDPETEEFSVVALPDTDSESENRIFYRDQVIGLSERKFLVLGRILTTPRNTQRFYVYDVDADEISSRLQFTSNVFTLNTGWAMSARGVIYWTHRRGSSDVRISALQTEFRPAESPWPFGIPTEPATGNDNRGWIDVSE